MTRSVRLRTLSDEQLTDELAEAYALVATEFEDYGLAVNHLRLSRVLLEVSRRQNADSKPRRGSRSTSVG